MLQVVQHALHAGLRFGIRRHTVFQADGLFVGAVGCQHLSQVVAIAV